MPNDAQPRRHRRSRARGARLPPGCVCVDRSTPWGNPFVVGVDGDAAECVRLYRLLLGGMVCLLAKASVGAQTTARRYVFAHLDELRGRDVACWCREGQPCHGDTLPELVAIAATTFHEVKP